jgi:hypothetical protein
MVVHLPSLEVVASYNSMANIPNVQLKKLLCYLDGLVKDKSLLIQKRNMALTVHNAIKSYMRPKDGTKQKRTSTRTR